MSDKRKLNRHNTGTVPKVKYTVKNRNNTSEQQLQHSYTTDRDNSRNLQNNLNSEWQPAKKSESNFHRNSPLFSLNYEPMDSIDDNQHVQNISLNGTCNSSSRTSSLNSRRNSTTTKCENVSIKYPNKKQIEDKLNQIKEYLHITTSLMCSLKNTDEHQNFECVGGVDRPDDHMNHEILRESSASSSFSDLKLKGEKKLRDARHLQEKLATQGNSNRMENNFQDLTVAKVEETMKQTNDINTEKGIAEFHQPDDEERIINEIEELQSQIQVMHTANEDRNKLIQILDKRDAELCSQHIELQNKLIELQTRKSQVDQLVSALQQQNSREANEDDDNNISVHVQRIVSMKDQLSKLKDMLELVESSEGLMQNGTQEEQAIACEIFNKAENFLNKGNQQPQPQQQQTALQYDIRSSPLRNLDKRSRKQVNKNNRECTSVQKDSKLALQAELAVKKKELEEIMGKHKASTSNLNHDFGTDNKSELSCNSLFDNNVTDWMQSHNHHDSIERYFSDNGIEDVNEYSEMHQQNDIVLPSATSRVEKYPSERHNSTDYLLAQTYERRPSSFTSQDDRNIRSSVNSSFSRGSSVSNMRQEKQNVQKQLELIRSVCDSMLPQNNQQNPSTSNVQNLRNNLTPSPTYSELGTFSAPPVQNLENNWTTGQPVVPFTDVANYQSWLTTNTLQAQAFMLTSLNQCYQMLWLQQRELESLRTTIGTMPQQQQQHSSVYNNEENESHPNSSQKVNPACSLPNLTLPPVSMFGNHRMNNLDMGRHNNLSNETNHIWNGSTALNNQVPPGNRANNYWDNFRSYSRQNLLSTKSNDLGQNLPTNMSSNSTTTHANNLRGSIVPAEIQQQQTTKRHERFMNGAVVTVPPLEDLSHKNGNSTLSTNGLDNVPDGSNNYPYFNRRTQATAGASPSRQNSNMNSTPATGSDQQNQRRRNVKSRNSEEVSRSKLFEELKENIFKEVASLISANEARPHFLIQLFKHLRLVSSDPLRLKTLQSIQTLTSSHSIRNLQQQQQNQLDSSLPNQEIPSSVSEFSMQSTVWSPIPPNSVPRNATILEGLISKKETPHQSDTFHEIIPFLNENEHLTIDQYLLAVIKQKILETKSFRREVKDTIFQKHFSNILDDVLNFYINRPVCSVKTSLLQSVRDLLKRELSFMNLIQNTSNVANGDSQINELVFAAASSSDLSKLPVRFPAQETVTQIQNEDLAEADQSHVEDEDIDEEGAVGGILEEPTPQLTTLSGKETDDNVGLSESFVTSTEAESQFQLGLDRVPTRLPTITKSRSNTPNKDRSLKHDDDQEHSS